MKISSRQSMILDFIKSVVKKKGYPPSMREIADAVGLASSSTVHGHLNKLKMRGLITWEPSCPRTLKVMHYEEIGN